MEATLHWKNQDYLIDFKTPHDISIRLIPGGDTVNCFYAPLHEVEPLRAGSFVGDTRQGGAVNFYNIRLNPHGNGTHTECVGHIAIDRYAITDCLQEFHFPAKVISLYPQRMPDGDRIITREQLTEVLAPMEVEALVIRTLPNDAFKQQVHYSGTNPPYLDAAAAEYLVAAGIKHLLIDLPSVDREEDGGQLLAHRAFWQYPNAIRETATITELIYVDNTIPDGWYLLNLQIASFTIDASPSKPVLYPLRLITR
ncbi:MAG: cyclase family protein [Lewinellaceae bacterium]|nr:cyclase family protein [Lewinellaceae bacterium]